MHVNSVKEALDNDDGIATANCAMKIEKDHGLSESRWESVLWFHTVNGSSGIGNKNAVVVVDGNDNPPLHQAFPTVKADSEIASAVRRDTTTVEIRMHVIQPTEFKRQRLVGFAGDWRRLVCDRNLAAGRSARRLAGTQREPLLKPKRRIANRTTLHHGDEIQHIAAKPAATLGDT